jgi:hypothetical protein
MSKGCASGIYKTVRSRLVNGLRRRSAHCGYNVTIYYWYFGESDVEDVELIMRGRLSASRPFPALFTRLALSSALVRQRREHGPRFMSFGVNY